MVMRLAHSWVSDASPPLDASGEAYCTDRNLFHALSHLSRCLLACGNYDDAEALNRTRLFQLETFLGRGHIYTTLCRGDLAFSLACTGKFDDASQLFESVWAVIPDALGAEHPKTMQLKRNYACFLLKRGMLAESERMYRDLLSVSSIRRPKGTSTFECMANLAIALSRQGKCAEAQMLNRQLLADEARLLGVDHHRTKQTRERLDDVMQRSRVNCASTDTHDNAGRVVNPNDGCD